VNERLSFQPDLNDRRFALKLDGTKIDLAFGKAYVLMMDFSPEAPGVAWRSPNSPPPYVLSVKDGGFEVDDANPRRVHVLQGGGPLAVYDGKPFSELLKAIGYVLPKG
jgi:hypothetical protein